MIFRYSSEASVILAFFSRVTNRNGFYSKRFNLQLVNSNFPPIVWCPCPREAVSPLYPTPTQPMDQPLDKPSIACHTHVAWLFLVCQSNFGARHDTTQSYRLNPVNHFWIEGLEKKCRTESPKSSRCYSNKRRPFRLWNSYCKDCKHSWITLAAVAWHLSNKSDVIKHSWITLAPVAWHLSNKSDVIKHSWITLAPVAWHLSNKSDVIKSLKCLQETSIWSL